VAATLNGMGGHLSYYRKASENLHFGVELESNLKMGESVATFGYQVDVPKAEFGFKGKRNQLIGNV
jgi:mitochondrial import receptor subunit TOM40